MLLNAYVLGVLAAVALTMAITGLARRLNLGRQTVEVPEKFRGVLSPEDYALSGRYQRASATLEEWQDAVYFLIVAGFVLWGGLGWLDSQARGLGLGELATGLVFVGLTALGSALIGLPFEIGRTFGIEAKYGFNTTTPWVFITDRLKGLVLTVVLGGGLLALILLAYQHLGNKAWLAAWTVTALFTAVMLYLGPVWLMPLFNKFTPLESGELRSAIEEYAGRQGFRLTGLFVMDGSRRSTKANAFVTGFGKNKRISLYDTLIDKLSVDEVLAVLAHEVGHARHGHLRLGYGLAMLKMGVVLYALQVFLGGRALQLAFGVSVPSAHVGLVIFGLAFQPLALLLGVAANAFSRRWEFQADAHGAGAPGGPRALILALVSLSKVNYANLTPHPLWVWLNASHPPVLARISRLEARQPVPYQGPGQGPQGS
jgi:STE24 endopeptidase